MSVLEDPRHERFVQELVKGSGQGEAYLAAGFNAKSVSVASAAATRLLKNVKIQDRFNELKGRIAQKVEDKMILTLEQHMSELERLRELSKQNGQLSAAIKAEELRGKLRRFYVDQVEHGDVGEFAQASDDDLDEFIEAEVDALSRAKGNGGSRKG